MAVGTPINNTASGDPDTQKAVLYLRVLNVRSGRPLYTRQIAREFSADRSPEGTVVLPLSAATAAVTAVSQGYFERVAGSRQEFRRPGER
jgi:hypothetical protein